MAKGYFLRNAEYVPTASFLMTSFERDREELATRFKEFTTAYVDDFSAQAEKVDRLEQALGLTAAQKGMTTSLYGDANTLNDEMNFVSFYFKRAGLDAKLVSAVKKSLEEGDIEEACLKTSGLIQYINANKMALEDKGMATTFADELAATRESLAAKNKSQNDIMNLKNELYRKNRAEYELLYDYITTVTEAGKIMYQGKGKRDEYVIGKMLSRMRRPGAREHGGGNG